ncbi:MAG: hypothetical protein JXA72_00250 [Bacteroidales bacterium]|nr:hypothetical protein [Bacteroidales bacterium]
MNKYPLTGEALKMKSDRLSDHEDELSNRVTGLNSDLEAVLLILIILT